MIGVAGIQWMTQRTSRECRWVVVMPRYPSPAAPAGTERLVRTLLVAYKGRDQVVPVVKVWLDGAIARPVLGYKGSASLQCALVLHRLHAAPSGAHITGEQGAPHSPPPPLPCSPITPLHETEARRRHETAPPCLWRLRQVAALILSSFSCDKQLPDGSVGCARRAELGMLMQRRVCLQGRDTLCTCARQMSTRQLQRRCATSSTLSTTATGSLKVNC